MEIFTTYAENKYMAYMYRNTAWTYGPPKKSQKVQQIATSSVVLNVRIPL